MDCRFMRCCGTQSELWLRHHFSLHLGHHLVLPCVDRRQTTCPAPKPNRRLRNDDFLCHLRHSLDRGLVHR